jgi:hypothetical protein
MDSQFERLLREKLQLMVDMRVEALTVTGCGSWDNYNIGIGYLDALRHAILAIDEVQQNMRQE